MFITMYINFFTLFFLNDTATTEIYTLSLHDALPISDRGDRGGGTAAGTPRLLGRAQALGRDAGLRRRGAAAGQRSEEHTSELQSRRDLVCRLLLEKKNIK